MSQIRAMKRQLRTTNPQALALLNESRIIINGRSYCRAHLRRTCAECMQDFRHESESEDEGRRAEGCKPVGDAGLDGAGDPAATLFALKEVKAMMANGSTGDIGGMPAAEMRAALEAELAAHAAQAPGKCTACAWKGCTAPPTQPLKHCQQCQVVLYCSKECQKLDWRWEHRAECAPRA